MGQRANLVIVEDGGYELYYDHWCANTLPSDLFWGPEHARRFIEAQKRVGTMDWLDDVWAEGGAVMDLDRMWLLIFGGEDERYDIDRRRMMLALMQKLWDGWEIHWVHEGIGELAEYVGVPREHVLAEKESPLADLEHEPPKPGEWVDTVISITFESGITRLYPQFAELEYFLHHGLKLLQAWDANMGFEELNLETWGAPEDHYPTSGCHLDMRAKRIDLWHAMEWARGIKGLLELWPGWNLEDHRDHYEHHTDWAGGKLRFRMRDHTKMLQEIRTMLLQPSRNPIVSITSVIDTLTQEGKKVEISPHALLHESFSLPVEARERLFQHALEALERD